MEKKVRNKKHLVRQEKTLEALFFKAGKSQCRKKHRPIEAEKTIERLVLVLLNCGICGLRDTKPREDEHLVWQDLV